MTVTLKEVSEAFDALIAGTRPREEFEKWAQQRMQAEDAGELSYEPAHAESRIWEGIKYLLGVAMETEPGEYLHVAEDFVEFRKTHGL